MTCKYPLKAFSYQLLLCVMVEKEHCREGPSCVDSGSISRGGWNQRTKLHLSVFCFVLFFPLLKTVISGEHTACIPQSIIKSISSKCATSGE